MPKEKDPFKNGPPAVVSITHEGPSHLPEVIGPAMVLMALEFHKRLNQLSRGGMCDSCVGISMFSTVVLNLLGGFPASARPGLIQMLHHNLEAVASGMDEVDVQPVRVMIDEPSDMSIGDLIADIKKMH